MNPDSRLDTACIVMNPDSRLATACIFISVNTVYFCDIVFGLTQVVALAQSSIPSKYGSFVI